VLAEKSTEEEEGAWAAEGVEAQMVDDVPEVKAKEDVEENVEETDD